MHPLLLLTIVLVGIFLLTQTLLPLFWPTKWIYFFSFRQQEQREHEKMIADIKDHIKRRNEFFDKIKEFKNETS